MPNLNSRLNRIESSLGISDSKRAFFFRENPNVPGKAEKRFYKTTPDLDNYSIHVYCFGKDNLN